MAEQKTAVLKSNEELGPETRLLTFVLAEGVEFPYVAGKYIIVDTGLLLPDGKVRKRAYTLISFDVETGTFEIAVRHVGAATEYLHALKPGEELRFSGPWGKYLPHEADADERIWVIATDTGVTAALGLLRAPELKGRLSDVKLFWWLSAEDYFLPKMFVEGRLPSGLGSFEIVDAPATGDAVRAEAGKRWVSGMLDAERPTRVYLSGDGSIVLPWLEMFAAADLPTDRVHLETFFNHAKSKA